jgi:hypothetical protein
MAIFENLFACSTSFNEGGVFFYKIITKNEENAQIFIAPNLKINHNSIYEIYIGEFSIILV